MVTESSNSDADRPAMLRALQILSANMRSTIKFQYHCYTEIIKEIYRLQKEEPLTPKEHPTNGRGLS